MNNDICIYIYICLSTETILKSLNFIYLHNKSLISYLDSDEIKSMSNMTVSLAGVSRIQLQADLPVMNVQAMEPGIMAFVDLMNQTESEIT